jgi:PAS domain S-box-containing protein
MVGKRAADVVSAAVAAEVARHDREVIASGTPHVYEESTVVAGRLRTFLTCRAPLRDPSGTIIGLIGAARDITERKQAETALRESEERFRTFTEQTLVGVYVIQGGQFRYVNAALAAMFGYEIGELLGKKAPLDLVHPEDAAWLKESMQRRLVGQEEAAHHVWRGVRKDGSLIYCEVLGRAIEYEGQPALMGNVLNITEQKQAEQALQESERLHRLLTEEATDLISREAPDGAVLYVTPSCRRLLGFDPVDLIGMHGPDFIHPDDRERVVNLIDEHAAKGVDTCGVQHRLRRKDGSYVWVETNGRLLRNEKGELAEIHCVTRDITDRKEAEAALARSEQLHRASVEAAGAVPYCRDYTADRYVFVGVGMEALTGCRREEFTARVWDDMVQEVVPTGAFAGLAYAEAMKKFRTERQLAWTADYRIRTRQGEERWVGCAAVDTRDDQGNSLVSIGLFMDITERKRAEEALRESEQKYRLLHDSMMDAFVQTSMDGRIREFNRAYREMLGYTGDELRSLTYMDLTPSKWHEMEARIVREQIIPQGHSDVYEKEYKKKDGTVFPVELRVFLIRNSQGQPASMWAIVRDISDRKKVENLLRQAREDLERRVAERTTELARANEALKKEIAEREHAEDALRSLSGRLLQLQDEERRRLARELHDATAQSLAVLAMNLTAIGKQSSRLDSGVRRMINESMSLAEQCSHEIRTTSYLLHPPLLDEFGLATALQWFADGFTQRSSVKVELDVAANVGRMPREIETTLFRIVQEGLSNIHRHSGSPVARIRVSRDANQVTLVVQDEGRGMPPAAPGDSKARIGRLGVGIIGMRERVRQLHGRLEIHSSAKGTVITVALPVGDTSS